MKRVIIKRIFLSLLVLLLFSFMGTTYYFYTKYTQTLQNVPMLSMQNPNDTQKLINNIGKFLLLPTNEDPSVARVIDVNKLKTQPFFAQAKNGDIVIVYTKNRKAILFDPSIQKIVEVGPLLVGNNASPQEPATTNEPKVSIYNGTGSPAAAADIADQLKQQMPRIQIVKTDNITKNTYKKTIVVDVTNRYQGLAAEISRRINGTVEQLPAGEITPQNEDIIIVLEK